MDKKIPTQISLTDYYPGTALAPKQNTGIITVIQCKFPGN